MNLTEEFLESERPRCQRARGVRAWLTEERAMEGFLVAVSLVVFGVFVALLKSCV